MAYGSLFIGTDYYSNCRACGRKVAYKLSKCPYCQEPDPQLKNWMGRRINYTKSLDPSVPSTSLWSSLTSKDQRHATLKLIGIATAFVIDHYTSDSIITRLNLPKGGIENWAGTLYVIPFIVLAYKIADLLTPQSTNSDNSIPQDRKKPRHLP